jgi:hypothetical protein
MNEYNVETCGSFEFQFNVIAVDEDSAKEQAQDFLSLVEKMCSAAGHNLDHEPIDWDVY